MDRARNIHSLDDVEPGDHLCCLCRNEEKKLEVLSSFLRQGLDGAEKVLYIGDVNGVNDILGYFDAMEYDIRSHLESGRLALPHISNAFLEFGFFDPDLVTARLWEEMELSREGGYSGFRVAGEMHWRSWEPPGSGRMMEYEAKLDSFLEENSCTALCMYNLDDLAPEVILGALATHPLAVVDGEIFANFYYIPPEGFLGDERPNAILRRWLRNLEHYRCLEGRGE